MTKPKPARDLTTEGALRRLFPKEVRHWLKEQAREQSADPLTKARKAAERLRRLRI